MVRPGEPLETFPFPKVLVGGNSTRMTVRATHTGYVLAVTNGFHRFLVFVLLAHTAVAVAHTLWCLFGLLRGRANEAWGSIPELVVLVQQSTPGEKGVLSNTYAGIRSLDTLEKVAVVKCGGDGPGQEELQLSLGGGFRAKDEERGKTRPKPGVEYGEKRD